MCPHPSISPRLHPSTIPCLNPQCVTAEDLNLKTLNPKPYVTAEDAPADEMFLDGDRPGDEGGAEGGGKGEELQGGVEQVDMLDEERILYLRGLVSSCQVCVLLCCAGGGAVQVGVGVGECDTPSWFCDGVFGPRRRWREMLTDLSCDGGGKC